MRYKEYLLSLDLQKRILEIGPLHNPIIAKHEGNVYYADIRTTKKIKEVYSKQTHIQQSSICNIDYVIHESYAKTLRQVEKFDYIISSHVLEHIPRLIDFFLDVHAVLKETGEMYFFLPDSRYCFDHFRFPTSFAELYHVHTQNLPCAPWRVLDGCMAITCNDPAILQFKDNLFSFLATRSDFTEMEKHYEKALEGDIGSPHFSVFTPQSFLLLVHDLIRVGLFPYTLQTFFPTPPGKLTFGGVLRHASALPTDAEASAQEMQRIRRIMREVEQVEQSMQAAIRRPS